MQDFRSINSTLEVSAELLRGPGVFGGASLASAAVEQMRDGPLGPVPFMCLGKFDGPGNDGL